HAYLLFCFCLLLFYFTHTATPDIYTLSLHDALPISTYRRIPQGGPRRSWELIERRHGPLRCCAVAALAVAHARACSLRNKESLRSEEHTSELQSLAYLVCRLLLEKKKAIQRTT